MSQINQNILTTPLHNAIKLYTQLIDSFPTGAGTHVEEITLHNLQEIFMSSVTLKEITNVGIKVSERLALSASPEEQSNGEQNNG